MDLSHLKPALDGVRGLGEEAYQAFNPLVDGLIDALSKGATEKEFFDVLKGVWAYMLPVDWRVAQWSCTHDKKHHGMYVEAAAWSPHLGKSGCLPMSHLMTCDT